MLAELTAKLTATNCAMPPSTVSCSQNLAPPFGHRSLQAFRIGELDRPSSPSTIQCMVDSLVEGMVAASRMNCPKGGIEVKLEIERRLSVSGGKPYITPSFGESIDNLW